MHLIFAKQNTKMNDEENLNDELNQKSKTRIKKEMLGLQELGEKLLSLNNVQLSRLALPSDLMEAILEAKKIASRNAKRRQLQYIGRLMRNLDDPSFIEEFLQRIAMKHQKSNAVHHLLESWRDKLLSDDPNRVTEFIDTFHQVDRQRLRQLIQNAKKEKLTGKPAGASRHLFRYIKEVYEKRSD